MTLKQHHIGLIDRYRKRLPVSDDTQVISLGEGNTPLIKLSNIPATLSREVDIYVKCEGLNPTGSFKDRGMTMAVTKAIEEDSKAIICASTGNTSASATAYAANAGITAFVLIPEGKIAQGKLAQAMIAGAIIVQVEGNFDDGMRMVKKLASEEQVTIVNSINPYRLQGQKTAAFEIVDELGKAPDFHCLPVGNAGNIVAYWIGYSEYSANNSKHVTDACTLCDGDCHYINRPISSNRPKMLGYQASGAAPFIRGSMVNEPETLATAIRIGHPQSWQSAWIVKQESGGWFDECSDAEILSAQKLLAEKEGIFCEPASATSLAGLMRDIDNGKIAEGSCIVCTLTGHGLKDPDIAIAQSNTPIVQINAQTNQIKQLIQDNINS